MQRLLKPLAVVLVVPLLCTAIAVAARERVDERWQAGLRREFIVRRQPVNERLIARYSLASLCSDGRTAVSIRPCRPYRLFSRLGTASFAVGVLGVLFLGAIAIAGEASRRRGRRVRMFRLGLYATIAGLVVLVLVHGVLGIVGLYLLGEVVERWPVSFVFAGVVAALLAVLSMTQVALSFSRNATAPLVGRLLDRAAHPRLAAVLTDVAGAVDAPPPEQVVAGLVPQFFVTAGRFLTLDGRVRGRTLYLSLPLARILSIDEFRALLGHELAHYSRAEQATSLYDNLHAGARRALQALRANGRGIRFLVNLPAVSVLSFFLESFAPAPAADASSSRELQADQVAARVAGAETLASALAKVHAFAPAWVAVADAMDRAVAEGTQYVNASELFARVVAANSVAERFVSIGGFSLAHPTDTLPPFSVRLSALAVDPPRVAAGALATSPALPAAALLEDHEAVERDLSQVEQRLLAMGRAHLEGEASADGN